MESQPQNPEFKNSEIFHTSVCVLLQLVCLCFCVSSSGPMIGL